jgi:hypothetical protein
MTPDRLALARSMYDSRQYTMATIAKTVGATDVIKAAHRLTGGPGRARRIGALGRGTVGPGS